MCAVMMQQRGRLKDAHFLAVRNSDLKQNITDNFNKKTLGRPNIDL